MAKYDYLFLALGNPGSEYEFTRHNIGWLALDYFMDEANIEFTKETNMLQLVETKYAGKSVLLAKPLTYMNLSGKAAKVICRDFNLNASNIVALVDEYNFPLSKVHLRQGGSDGGHNGLKSLIEELGTPNFWRLRLGIDKDFGPGGLVDYVLGKFKQEEEDNLLISLKKTSQAIKHILKIGSQRAMSDINSGKLFE
jgi:PTH1 family peptidyl-tRNA hydrolase